MSEFSTEFLVYACLFFCFFLSCLFKSLLVVSVLLLCEAQTSSSLHHIAFSSLALYQWFYFYAGIVIDVVKQ